MTLGSIVELILFWRPRRDEPGVPPFQFEYMRLMADVGYGMLSGPTQLKSSDKASPDKYLRPFLLPHFVLDCCLDVLYDDVMVSHIDWAAVVK